MPNDKKVDYIELPANNFKVQQAFFESVFDFPGGRRFHFTDSHGNEYAVWTDKQPVS